MCNTASWSARSKNNYPQLPNEQELAGFFKSSQTIPSTRAKGWLGIPVMAHVIILIPVQPCPKISKDNPRIGRWENWLRKTHWISVPKEQIQIFRKHILKHTYIIPPKSNFRCSNYSLDMVPEMGVAPKSPILIKFSITNHPRVPPF